MQRLGCPRAAPPCPPHHPPSDAHADGDADRWLNRATPLLLRTFTSRPHLSRSVRSIAIRCLPNRVELLRRCPHIALLHLVGNYPPPLAQECLDTLPALGLRPSVLVISASADRDLIYAALAALPSVRHVVMKHWGVGSFDLALPSASQLLSMTSRSSIDFSKLCVRPATVPATEIQFEDLNLKYLHFPENLTSIEQNVARSLRALATQTWPSSIVLGELTALESFVVGSLPYQSSRFTLPLTLLHFGFHAHYGTFGHESASIGQIVGKLFAALSEGALPILQIVSATRHGRSTKPPER
ncbi:hypothetical protein FA95DRAFT_1031972 [Auriscalpium vulgare]|uniref:Uncharacterized protein n=1 Tax=Auriscalpium vulgare TaxID=40419 RepID=A0ACB8RXH4_9AGAM|nr:hypothetical protein FA95DRAFT_1031972 [Auriscalpium vulgare]